MLARPLLAPRDICPLAAQLAHLHRRLSQNTRLRATANPTAVAIYVHALATEDVVVQVLLRGTQPLMLEHLPQLKDGSSWQTDAETVRQYAKVTCNATRNYLARLETDDAGSLGNVSREAPGALSVVSTFRVLLIPVLERAAREIAELSGNRSTGGARVPSRGGRKFSRVAASSKLNDASRSQVAPSRRQAYHR